MNSIYTYRITIFIVLSSLMIILLSSSLRAQPFCYVSSFFLHSQKDVDEFILHYFPNDCDSIAVELLIINGDDITNLKKLNNKKIYVWGAINIHDNPLLESLEGLQVFTDPNPGFGLRGIYISNNPQLKDLKGFAGIEYVLHSVDILNNQSLESLEGLNNLEKVEFRISINDNLVLKSLKGLDGLKNLYALLEIKNNASLSSLEGLHNMDYIRELRIENNPLLKNLNGLQNLKANPLLYLINNTNLSSINGLRNINPLNSHVLQIKGSPLLTECAIAPICDILESKPDVLTVENNGSGCNVKEEIEEVCLSTPEPPPHDDCAGALQLDFQKDICDHIQYECGYATSSTAINCEQPHWWVDVWYKVTSIQPEFYIEIGILPADSVNMIVYRQCGGLHAFCGAVKPHNSYKIEAPPAHYRIRLSWETSRPDDTMELCAWEPETVSTVERNLSQNFSFFPNPARNEVRIVWDEQPKGEIYVELMNISGQVVKREKMKAGIKEYTLMLSPFSGGLYFVRIHHEDGATSTQKLIILD